LKSRDAQIDNRSRDAQIAYNNDHINLQTCDYISIFYFIFFRLQPHPIFERRGPDLYTNLTISLQDALVGFQTEINHLDGHKVKVTRGQTTWHGFKMRIKNEGMPLLNDNTRVCTYLTIDYTTSRLD